MRALIEYLTLSRIGVRLLPFTRAVIRAESPDILVEWLAVTPTTYRTQSTDDTAVLHNALNQHALLIRTGKPRTYLLTVDKL